jgi:polyphosphate kinase
MHTKQLASAQNKTHICTMSYINRELSWLSFNERVLQEAMDVSVPLIERIRFLGIYSNNMDEFYRVRVANIKRMISLQNKKVEGFSGTPRELYDEIRAVVVRQQKIFEDTYTDILESLEKDGIHQLTEKTVSEEQREELQHYFHEQVIHDLVPIILEKKTPLQKVRDKAIYLAVKMEWDSKRKVRYALIEVPTTIPRFYILKSENTTNFILIDDIIRLNLNSVFTIFSYDSIEAFTFKFTRDAELNLDDDVSMSLIEKMEKSIKLRKKGEPVRVVFDHQMPEDLLSAVLRSLNISRTINSIPGGRYHNFKDFMRFPDFGKQNYLFPEYEAAPHPLLGHTTSLIKQIQKSDVLLHFPYQRFDHVVDLLREAAIDPKVKSIKINVYRVAKNSQVMNALINAVRNGKHVMAVLELQARFDEENNLYWAERLKDEGAQVVYGYENLKIHSKLIQIKRISNKKEQLITYVGTGNFNERTAKIYTDLGLITLDRRIGTEVQHVFHMMEHSLHRHTFRYLMVAPINARRKLMQLIQQEISVAKTGKKARIQMKINNLVDRKLIDKLYEASNAGVEIDLIIRGVCCLVPGIKKKSEGIRVISIVDRFLEHSRFMIFHNNGNPHYYLTSGDWMERNLDKRIEVGCPVYQKDIQQELQLIFDTQWKDNVKARIIDKKQLNRHVETTDPTMHSQQWLQEHYHERSK